MDALTIYPNTKQEEMLYKQLAKALQNRIESKSVNDNPYNEAFVAKIARGKQEKKAREYKTIKVEDLWK